MKNLTFSAQICNHKSALQLFAMKFTHNLDDADDLVQDTLLRAMRYENMFKSGTNIKAWLYTIMKNTFINNYRSKNIKRGIIDTREELNYEQLSQSATDNLATYHFMGKDISKAISLLGTQYSIPFLRYFEGYKYHEIVVELNIPIGTVKTRIHVARQLLKASLKIYNEEFKKSNKCN
ncbi:RNA polymerase sigma factor [Pedobacter sp. AW31-3R]|uniref:RNA polymerase sigma factor n=1 Tax=Pedobacter sp. AW31-3R TaxID=3445781 RepID=UPI003FA0A898